MDLLINQSAPNPSGQGWITETTARTFVKDVVEASLQSLVLVDFWAPWCGPCKQLTPLLEKVVNGAGGALRLAKVNIDQSPEIAGQFGIQSVPTVIAVHNGQPVDGFAGVVSEAQLKTFLSRLVKLEPQTNPAQDLLADAEAAQQAGDLQTAAALYTRVISLSPEEPLAYAGLLRCLLAAGAADDARRVLDQVPPALRSHAAIRSVEAVFELVSEGNGAADVTRLEETIARNPADHAARYELALALFIRGAAVAAMEQLLESITRDRNWNEGAARARLLKIFEALGPEHPDVLTARRRLSSILFS